MDIKTQKRIRRHKKIRTRVKGTGDKPRFSVFRSNKHVYAQLIDDGSGKTLASACSMKKVSGQKTIDAAKETGRKIAQMAKEKKITQAVFDRSGYIFTGKIKAIAEGAKEGGLKM
ncbi:MAG: 50S ribosomal protein L18 [Candidatus Taylorbacteria bacterium RIFCSPLOWO2_12_FULL_43_20]|uniref:Large ribosomal subunit protein uL18 n=1 Tax=Candidatus Taylorbacteria bacterium RIFCSPLOWO2_12_FULL_43_20 TaxID=1802332 RepID=A0A1G2P2C2_9BACT|nr:MAG: 50S ribosomal protein L18 [Candidatus Taylorbacteria bacterium RIFCSPHIGHO2_01_FULL_43_120]OHA23461.1 MAG: 50S ribosomal protein L18 [Candidatus Taylorbacteria bacterium RIFCSPHIGHO2_02_FULL_43_55]OHA29666.1 MAG: 50S ribosomal protein L18 [Candidatus Taylorbacteria bacterium RIFCSPHIGHO2_12_FULL_42_34]OHA31594.1 MAG: 50S ribosomal protein L18 [Candidatus Taylorbacteria bacterium RIFCSPLOWO2_01_FULL_43_83]OHA38975.1 MAG: 50S ribosomal protein L18 [Candidatus Taylorbacteria bacterium RIFC